MLNLDTHILIYALEGTLKSSERKLLEANRWSISAIVLWEIAKLVQLKRVVLDLDSAEVVPSSCAATKAAFELQRSTRPVAGSRTITPVVSRKTTRNP